MTNNQNSQLTPEELFHKHKKVAKNTLYSALGEPHKMAKSKGVDYDDLLQVAYIGLWEACLNYDHTKSRFKSHAINNIRWALYSSLSHDFNYFKYSSHGNKNNAPDNPYALSSFDATIPHEDESRSLHDSVGDDSLDSLESEVMCDVAMEEYTKHLSDRQKEIVRLKADGWLEVDIADYIGISKQAVDQNVNSIIRKIKKTQNITV